MVIQQYHHRRVDEWPTLLFTTKPGAGCPILDATYAATVSCHKCRLVSKYKSPGLSNRGLCAFWVSYGSDAVCEAVRQFYHISFLPKPIVVECRAEGKGVEP